MTYNVSSGTLNTTTPYHWNLSITFSAIRLAILNTCLDPESGLWSASGSKRNQIVQTPQLSTHKISSKSVHNLLRYPAKIQKSGVNPNPWSGLWSGSSSKRNQFVQAPKSVHNLLRYPTKIKKSSVNLAPGSGVWSGSGSKVNQFVHVPTSVDTQHFIQIHAHVFE